MFTLSTTAAVDATVPDWPRYITNDWFVNDSEEEILRKIKLYNLTPDTSWQLYDQFHFTPGMWTPEYQEAHVQRIKDSAGSKSDQARLESQRRAVQFHGGVNPQPVILSWRGIGYELIQGWHRTVTHFSFNPNGYVGPAWIADGLGADMPNLVNK